MKNKGFTLAEVLITLAIIGVIAAISVPSLIQKTNQAELITAWKKEFATLSQASAKYSFDIGSISKVNMANDFGNYIKVVKKCSNSAQDGVCWHNVSQSYYLNGSTVDDSNNGVPVASSFISSSGTLYLIYNQGICSSNITNYNHEDSSCGQVFVDINGFKKPNTWGKDIFGTNVYSDGTVMPMSSDTDTMTADGYNCDSSTATSNNGAACSALYLYQQKK